MKRKELPQIAEALMKRTSALRLMFSSRGFLGVHDRLQASPVAVALSPSSPQSLRQCHRLPSDGWFARDRQLSRYEVVMSACLSPGDGSLASQKFAQRSP